jgi:hypothetical protein
MCFGATGRPKQDPEGTEKLTMTNPLQMVYDAGE